MEFFRMCISALTIMVLTLCAQSTHAGIIARYQLQKPNSAEAARSGRECATHLTADGSTVLAVTRTMERGTPMFNVQINGTLHGPYRELGKIITSKLGGGYAYTFSRDGGGRCLAVKGRTYGPYPFLDDIRLSDNGAHVLFSGKTERASDWAYNRSFRYCAEFCSSPCSTLGSCIGPLGFVYEHHPSPVFGKERRTAFVRKDDKVIGYWHSVERILLSGDGGSYAVQYRKSDSGPYSVRINGRDFDMPSHWIWDNDALMGYSDNTRFAFTYKSDSDNAYRLYDNGTSAGPFEFVTKLHAGRDSSSAGYFYKKNGEWHVRTGSRQFGPCDYHRYWTSGTGEGFAYTCGTGNMHRDSLIVNGRTLGTFEGLQAFAFSDDGKHYGFSYIDENRIPWLQVDNKKYGISAARFSSEHSPVFSPNGDNFLFKYEGRAHQYYVKSKDDLLGPYIHVDDMHFDESGSFAFVFTAESQNGASTRRASRDHGICINGRSYAGYKAVAYRFIGGMVRIAYVDLPERNIIVEDLAVP